MLEEVRRISHGDERSLGFKFDIVIQRKINNDEFHDVSEKEKKKKGPSPSTDTARGGYPRVAVTDIVARVISGFGDARESGRTAASQEEKFCKPERENKEKERELERGQEFFFYHFIFFFFLLIMLGFTFKKSSLL